MLSVQEWTRTAIKQKKKKMDDVLNYTQLLLTYNLLEETRIHDVTINNILVFFYHTKKVHSMLP